jgi:hypothetical protein
MPTYFNQKCPTCRRPHRVNVDYLGEDVRCGHCYARFKAQRADQSCNPAGRHTDRNASHHRSWTVTESFVEDDGFEEVENAGVGRYSSDPE